jgi:aminopeptidase-like protein
MRSPDGGFSEYHTSADNLQFIHPDYLADSLRKCVEIVKVLEGNRTYINQNPRCEPRLGKRGLYRAFGCDEDQIRLQQAVLWVLNLSDGEYSLLDIAARSEFSFAPPMHSSVVGCWKRNCLEMGARNRTTLRRRLAN